MRGLNTVRNEQHTSSGSCARATVSAVHTDSGTVELEGLNVTARMLSGMSVRVSDTVLFVHDGSEFVVLGTLSQGTATEVSTSDGMRASLNRDAAGREVLAVTDANGALVFEHDASTGRTVVAVPRGDLVLSAPEGHVEIRSGRTLSLRAEESFSMQSGEKIALQVETHEGGSRSEVLVNELGTTVTGEEVRVTARTGVGMIDQMRLVARSLTSTVETVRQVAGVVEMQAGRLIERVKNAYREVEELAQTRAGRIRMVARDTATIKAKHTTVSAEGDMKLAGEKVYIG